MTYARRDIGGEIKCGEEGSELRACCQHEVTVTAVDLQMISYTTRDVEIGAYFVLICSI
jgi:hypothetical protein